MVSIVTYGRNDNYGYNLYKRTALSFNCLAEVLDDEDDEIFFVDYNTPGHLPTLPEHIWDTLTNKALRRLKIIRISPQLHERIKGTSTLPILENVSRNAAIVRSNPRNHWILSTNPDVVVVLGSKWASLNEIMQRKQDSFYELPRFDIPESVWSSLLRTEPRNNMSRLRDWLRTNRAAVVETVPDFRFQQFFLFDAPGDFQLAPRHYFLRLRGFDETMNLYFHSDSNLAKRMWLLNGHRCDHLLDDAWALHQDHYLSGEWSARNTTTKHNDYNQKVLEQSDIEAPNQQNWGLQDHDLPVFTLFDKVRHWSTSYPSVPTTSEEALANSNGNLNLSCEIDWSLQPLYRLCHYRPEVITLYLRELLQVVSPDTRIVYIGENDETLQRVSAIWGLISPQAPPIQDARLLAENEYCSADLLLVDCFYERSDSWNRKITLMGERLKSQVAAERMSQAEADEELTRYADNADAQNLREQLLPRWSKCLPFIRVNPGSYVVLLGCNPYMGAYFDFQTAFGRFCGTLQQRRSVLQVMHEFYQTLKVYLGSDEGTNDQRRRAGLWFLIAPVLVLRLKKRWAFRKITGHPSILGMIYTYHAQHRTRRLTQRLDLQTLYTHHRLVVLRTGMHPIAAVQVLTEKATAEQAVAS